MLPIRDTIPCKSYPVVNTLIIIANLAVYLAQPGQEANISRFFYTYGLVPARYTDPALAGWFSLSQQLAAPFTFMFLHGNFWHLAGNMWSLYIFGDNIEDKLGPFRYLVFYLLCGIASGFSHFFLNYDSQVPVIGASGAIAGVMGAYFILYPKAKILTLIPIIIIPYFVDIPAFIFLGLWFFLQFLNAASASAGSGSIAWWAHIGGFICGMFFLNLTAKIPSGRIDQRTRRLTRRKHTEKLQIIRPVSPENTADLYGTLYITPYEALIGTKKLVGIPADLKKRMFTVTVPPGISPGTLLRLKGLGRNLNDGAVGNLILKVALREDE